MSSLAVVVLTSGRMYLNLSRTLKAIDVICKTCEGSSHHILNKCQDHKDKRRRLLNCGRVH